MTSLKHTDKASMGRNSKERGKRDERDIARILGATRHHADTGGGEDCSHPDLVIQSKGGGNVITQVIRDGMASAKAAAVGQTKLPCVAVVDRRGTRLQRYIIFELEAYAAWHGYQTVQEVDDDTATTAG